MVSPDRTLLVIACPSCGGNGVLEAGWELEGSGLSVSAVDCPSCDRSFSVSASSVTWETDE